MSMGTSSSAQGQGFCVRDALDFLMVRAAIIMAAMTDAMLEKDHGCRRKG